MSEAAFAALEADGYRIGSAYTACRGPEIRFLYRDGLWHGADLLTEVQEGEGRT